MRVVCVIGMHRSGTSVVARMLNLLGVSLGPEDELLEPAPRNPAGFWENSRVVELNDELLDALGGNATTPPVLADGWEDAPELDALRERAGALVATFSDGGGLIAWKDPRLSLTLPFWRTVAPVTHIVHCLRDPVEAAPSLARWHPIDLGRAGELWLRYVVSACRLGEQLLVRYDEVMASPRQAASSLAAAFGLPEPGPETLESVETTIDPRLHRFQGVDKVDGTLALPSLLYRLLAEGGLPAAMPLVELLQRRWLEEEELRHVRGAAGELQRALNETKAALDELAAAERALRGRLGVRAALRLAQPAGPLLRRLRRS